MMTDRESVRRAETEPSVEARRLNRAISKALAGMHPPENLTVTEWAESKRYLSTESSAEPGLWRTSRTPYLRAIMDAFTDPKVRHIVLVAASQIGKTELINNIIGYIIDQNPGSILFVHPTTIDAREFSKLRIAPMIRDSPALRRKVSAPKSRDSGNTLLQKSYPGGILTLCGSTEAHALASKPIRYVFGDERDRWAVSAGTEGDPWELAMARQTTFYNAKAVEVSTPTIRGQSAIAKSFSKGTMERWKSQCPHCGEFHEIQWKNIRYDAVETVVNHERTYTVSNVLWLCPGCACVSDEATMKKQPAHWEADNPAAYANGERSFWLNAFVSPWASWESICLKYQNALGDTQKMQVVYNTCFGQLWEDRGDTQDPDTLMGRREIYDAELPEGVLVLTAGVDTQDDRFEYEIVGHGHFGETWGIEKGIIMGRPDDPTTWNGLDMMVFDRVLHFKDGLGLKVSMSFVDEGGHFPGEVRQFCHARISKKVFCIKGFYGPDRPFTSPPKKMKIVVKNRYLGTCWQYQLGVDSGKQMIMDNLRVQEPGPKYCHFPLRDDYGAVYFNGLLSEHLVPEGKIQQRWVWTKIPGHGGQTAYVSAEYIEPVDSTEVPQSQQGPSTVLKIQCVILRENWNGDGKDVVLECGQFELDTVNASGPPSVVMLKATSLPYTSTIRQTEKSKAWEGYRLSGIANEMAATNGMTCLYESKNDPRYDRVEQYKISDIAFLSKLCHDAGISLKVTNNILVLFDQAEYEAKDAAFTIKRGSGVYEKYKLDIGSAGTLYSSCRVSYVDPATGNRIEGIARVEDYDEKSKNNQQLEVTAKVATAAEAKALAEKRLRLHNKYTRSATFTMPGNPEAVAGVTVMLENWGGWDGKYIIKQAVHTVDSNGGYTTQVKLRRVLEGY